MRFFCYPVVLGALAARAYAQCDVCADPGNTVHTAIQAVFRRAIKVEMPVFSTLPSSVPSPEPIAFELLVNGMGTACMLYLVRPAPPDLVASIKEAVQRWVFRPALVEGRPVCLSARLLVYIKKDAGKLVVVVPGSEVRFEGNPLK
jgi:hypothetical protein